MIFSLGLLTKKMGGCGCCSGTTSRYTMESNPAKLDCGCGCSGLKKSDALKAKYSIQSALLFFLIANPYTYQFIRSMLGTWVASDSGCPTPSGLLLHSLVFGLIVFGLMKLTLPSPY